MATAQNVAKYFLMLAASGAEDAGESITHLKLQKLLYYAQGFHLALNGGAPLFDATIQAWEHGPVVRQVWNQYGDHGAKVIPADPEFDPSTCLTEDERGHLDDVWNAYGQFSAWKLRNMTHNEPPWCIAFARGKNSEITRETMKDYFLTLVQ